jgi:putative NADPH-quinone reductase
MDTAKIYQKEEDSMSKTIAIILGHPAKNSYCRALAESYKEGAEAAGHTAHFLALSDMRFDPIRK